MAPRIIGKEEPSEQPQRRRWQKFVGWQTIRVFRGTKSAIEDKVASLQNDAEEIELEGKDNAWTLTATFSDSGSNSVADDSSASKEPQWELAGNDLERDIKDHDYFQGDDTLKKAIVQVDVDFDGGKKNIAKIDYGSTKANEYRDLRLLGVEAYDVPQYVIRKTIFAGSRSTLKASFEDVGKVSTPPDISSAHFPLPAGEWLKKAPQVERKGIKFSIVQEWWHALKWSKALYGGTGTP